MITPEMYAINLKVVVILTIGFALASFFGYFAQRLKLSPILGYLLAGYMIGPFFPGFVADLELAEQLAEIGVMLMMFGVGLHFKWQDLINVKNIAIPGAIGQMLVTATVTSLLFYVLGSSWQIGLIIGIAIGVASTVVLVRVLSDQNLLNTKEGHIAIGWLIVEDLLTVMVLILFPTIVAILSGDSISSQEIMMSMFWMLLKFAILILVMFTVGRKLVAYALTKIAETRSQELFTLTILALIFAIATGAAVLFGASIALGAFIAGMVVGQTDVRHQASAYASPMKDTFAVIFFLSVGMLFNPLAIFENLTLFLSVLTIILVIKPLTAFFITVVLRYPMGTALTIAIALAQIGEFSFILAEESVKFHLFRDEEYDIIVACALVSISINPLIFRGLDSFKAYLDQKEMSQGHQNVKQTHRSKVKALVVGYGQLGQKIIDTLEIIGWEPLIIDHNVETVTKLIAEEKKAIYGEASFPNMLEMAKIESATFLFITLTDITITLNIIHQARQVHPDIMIIARAQYLEDRKKLEEEGIEFICCDEDEIGLAFDRIIFQFQPRLLPIE